jgi:uroporphyrinogen decarboxylase
VLHALLDKLAENIGDYAIFQIEAGAQVIQVFDSWAGNLSPTDYDIFAAPYVFSSPPPLLFFFITAGMLL